MSVAQDWREQKHLNWPIPLTDGWKGRQDVAASDKFPDKKANSSYGHFFSFVKQGPRSTSTCLNSK